MTRSVVSIKHVVYRLSRDDLSTPEEMSSREVPSLDWQRDAQDAPEGAFAFYYTSTVEATETYGNMEPVITRNQPIRLGGLYYLVGELHDREAVAKRFGDDSPLLRAMQFNDYEWLIECSNDFWQPFDVARDVLISLD